MSQGRWAPRRAFAATQGIALSAGTPRRRARVRLLRVVPGVFSGLGRTDMLITLAALPFALGWMLGMAVPLALDRYEAHAAPIAGQALLGLALTIPRALMLGLRGAIIAWTARTCSPPSPSRPPVAAAAARRARDARPAARGAALRLADLREQRLAVPEPAHRHLHPRRDRRRVRRRRLLRRRHHRRHDPLDGSAGRLDRAAARASPRSAASTSTTRRADVEGRALRHTMLVMVAGALRSPRCWSSRSRSSTARTSAPRRHCAIILLPGVACLGVGSVLISATSGRGRPRYAMINGLITTPIAIALYMRADQRRSGDGRRDRLHARPTSSRS